MLPSSTYMPTAKTWTDKNYSIVITEDGSPSLHWKLNEAEFGELMHHRGGALAETELIYGSVVKQAITEGARHFCSVGLGLGYNELMVAREWLSSSATEVPESFCEITSFEADPFLTDCFLNFLKNPEATTDTNEVYRDILARMAPTSGVKICSFLLKILEAGLWHLPGALSADFGRSSHDSKFDVVLYDAFSSKTSPQLWAEDFLNEFIGRHMSQKSLFSTYACTGPLKRSLKAQGFEVILREGFHGKRNSTLGRRV